MIATRPPEEIRRQYELEKKLAIALKSAPRAARSELYGAAYEEFHKAFPEHALLTRKRSPEATLAAVNERLLYVRPFLRPDTDFLELGAGDCSLALEIARRARTSTAVEVSDSIASHVTPPSNFRLVLSDALAFKAPPGSFDVIYSNDFVEHLHPEDAAQMVRNAREMLRPGGAFVCLTPNRLTGPHDVSGFFDDVATGLHLKEYTLGELKALLRDAGFRRFKSIVVVRRRIARIPVWPVLLCEALLAPLPHRFVRAIGKRFPLRHLLGANLVGYP